MKLRLAQSAREAIGSRLRELRKFHNLEQTEVAQMAGLSQAIISQYEKGSTEISLSFIAFLSEKFKISTEWFITGKATQLQIPDGYGKRAKTCPGDDAAGGKKGNSRFVRVAVVSPSAAARPGAVRDDAILGWQPVPSGPLAGRKNVVAVDVKASWVKNMGPAFRPTGRVVIDRDDKTVQGNRYYAVNESPTQAASITAIRRLNLGGSRLWFLEDHPAGAFAYVDLGPRLTLERAVIGRLVWLCQPL